MSRFTKALMLVLAAACSGLGVIWWRSLASPPEALIGEWHSAFYTAEPPSTLYIDRNGTYQFKTQKGKWHMEGDQVILEAFSESYDEQLRLSEDEKSLTDGTVDGTTFVRR